MLNKRHIEMFENFNLNSDGYTEVINKEVWRRVSIYNAPEKTSQLEDAIESDSEIELNQVAIKFDLDIQYKRSGIEGITLILKQVDLNGSILDYEGNIIDEFDIVDTDMYYEKYEVEMGTFPLYIEDVEINMNNTFDSSKWKYVIKIGNFN
jgi:hypothetical protein